MTDSSEPTVQASIETPAPIVARAGRYYRNARYLMTVGLIVMGAYFLYDGFKGYPERNKQIDAVNAAYDHAAPDSDEKAKYGQLQQKLGAKKSDTDIGLQKALGFGLPAAAVVYLVYFLRKSRGEVRLENDMLSVPGHPPVPIAAVKAIDNTLWKKKGIAVLTYDIAGRGGEITLDDFVYQQLPIDAIYDRVVAGHAAQDLPAVPTAHA